MFSLKSSFGEGPISLKNYLNTFVENVSDQDSSSDQLQYSLETLQFIPDIQISHSILECLTYAAGYAVFSCMKTKLINAPIVTIS